MTSVPMKRRGRPPLPRGEGSMAPSHCPQGHALTPDNLRFKKRGGSASKRWACRRCHTEYTKRWRLAHPTKKRMARNLRFVAFVQFFASNVKQWRGGMKVLKTDPARLHLDDNTGIIVRALVDGRPASVDIACLDKESLHDWLRSRGGNNEWAEHVVMLLLGHEWEDKK